MQITVKRLRQPDLILNVNGSDSIMDVKVKIQIQSAIPTDQQRLIFSGKMLENDRTLADYSIKDKYELHLVRRLQPFMINDRNFKERAKLLGIPPRVVVDAERDSGLLARRGGGGGGGAGRGHHRRSAGGAQRDGRWI